MAKRGSYTIKNIYGKSYSAFEPTPLSSATYPIQTGSLGITTDPRSANILQEVSSKLSGGAKNIEIEGVSPEWIDSIPKQHFEETRRLAKLIGANLSLHGPVMDTTGIDVRRGGYSETDRELAEKKVLMSLERGHELDPKGNIPVTFHSAEGLTGSEFQFDKDGKRDYKKIIAVNRETGDMHKLEEQEMFRPGGEKVEGVPFTPERRLNSINTTSWDNSIFGVETNREHAERLLQDVHPLIISRFVGVQTRQIDPKEISQEEEALFSKIGTAYEFVAQARLSADSLFSKAYEFAKKDDDKKALKVLEKYSKDYRELMGLGKDKKTMAERSINPLLHIQALRDLRSVLKQVQPKTFVPIEEFALEKSSQTYGNAAFKSYKQFKDNAPILSIENPPAGYALSTGEDVKNLVEKSKEEFVKRAVEEGMNRDKAKKAANKVIGATLDVGHMNMLRKYGYSEEDIVKESAKLAPILKHVHLSDNFGFEHTELPMGMGNVPLKEIMQKLGKKGFEARKIIEAGQWWQHFKSSPFQATLEQMGSPMYSTRVSPYWNQNIGLYQDYGAGYGMMLPQINYQTFGAGFSQLPSELGGQMPGAGGSRMGGKPME